MKAMIFAAGVGTRLKPWTQEHPKALAMVNGKSLLQRNIEWLQQFHIKEVMVNVHHFAKQITDAIALNRGWGSRITISDETEELLETGGGLKKTGWYFYDGPFVVINVDILTDMDLMTMIAFHEDHKPLATLAVTDRQSSRYFLFDENNELCGWRNSKTGEEKMARTVSFPEPKAFSGIHIIEPRIFSLIKKEGKFSIVDVYLDLARTEKIVAVDQSGSKLVDVGRPESLALAEALFP